MFTSISSVTVPEFKKKLTVCNVSLMCCLCNHYVTVYVLRIRKMMNSCYQVNKNLCVLAVCFVKLYPW